MTPGDGRRKHSSGEKARELTFLRTDHVHFDIEITSDSPNKPCWQVLRGWRSPG